mgnify:CR=1 FL=1|jgi:hypothetical protein
MSGRAGGLEKISKHFCNTLKSFFIQISKIFSVDETKRDFISTLGDYIDGINLLIERNKQGVIVVKFNKHFFASYSEQITKKDEKFFLGANETEIDCDDEDKTDIIEQIREIRKIYGEADKKTKDVVWYYIAELNKIGKMYNTILNYEPKKR